MKTSDHALDANFHLWWKHTPTYQDHKVGCFTPPSSLAQLAAAEAFLRAQGCTIAIGPMEGNTWRTHRAVIESDNSPPFLLEPRTPVKTAEILRSADYQILAQYTSSKIDLTQNQPNLTRLQSRLSHLKIRPLNLTHIESELRLIYKISIQTFTNNFLYTPISESEFLAQYLPFKPHLTPNCAFIAEHGSKPIGFVFGYPDQNSEDFIVKTLAVLPERSYAGLGTLLVQLIQDKAKEAGFRKAIHALQREDNQSLRISTRFNATIFRRYALFAKKLSPENP